MVSDVLSFYSLDGNDVIENEVTGNITKAGSRPSLLSSKSTQVGLVNFNLQTSLNAFDRVLKLL